MNSTYVKDKFMKEKVLNVNEFEIIVIVRKYRN